MLDRALGHARVRRVRTNKPGRALGRARVRIEHLTRAPRAQPTNQPARLARNQPTKNNMQQTNNTTQTANATSQGAQSVAPQDAKRIAAQDISLSENVVGGGLVVQRRLYCS